MKKTIAVVLLMLGSSVTLGDDQQLDEAREQLDQAARLFAELHVGRSMHSGDQDRPFLGVLLGPPSERGVQLIGVTPGSSAEAVGLRPGDIVTSLNGVSLGGVSRSANNLMQAIGDISVGDMVAVEVLRDDEPFYFDVEAKKHSMAEIMHSEGANWTSSTGFGMSSIDIEHGDVAGNVVVIEGNRQHLSLLNVDGDLGSYFGVDSGVLVVKSPADSQLKGGDIIQAVGDEEITNVVAAYRALGELSETTDVSVLRQRGVLTIPLEPQRNAFPQAPMGIRQAIQMGAPIEGLHLKEEQGFFRP